MIEEVIITTLLITLRVGCTLLIFAVGAIGIGVIWGTGL